MNDWKMIFLFCYLCPFLQIFLGVIIRKFPPKFLNSIYGYYSACSCVSKKMWDFAQNKYAQKSLIFGIILLIAVCFIQFAIRFSQTVKNCICAFFGIVSFIFVSILVKKECTYQLKKETDFENK